MTEWCAVDGVVVCGAQGRNVLHHVMLVNYMRCQPNNPGCSSVMIPLKVCFWCCRCAVAPVVLLQLLCDCDGCAAAELLPLLCCCPCCAAVTVLLCDCGCGAFPVCACYVATPPVQLTLLYDCCFCTAATVLQLSLLCIASLM